MTVFQHGLEHINDFLPTLGCVVQFGQQLAGFNVIGRLFEDLFQQLFRFVVFPAVPISSCEIQTVRGFLAVGVGCDGLFE